MQMKNNIKSEKGSMTVYTAVTVISFILILTTVFLSASSVRRNQIKTLLKIKETYEESVNDKENIYYGRILDKGVIITENNKEYNDGTGKAVIPVGFCVVKDSGQDKNTVENGLVISDVANDDLNNTAGGNQFVWVPCNTEGTNGLTKYTKDNQYNDGASYYYLDSDGEPYDDWTDDGGNQTSVNKYGGFYVARFEAGVPEEADFYPNTDEKTYYTSSSKNVTKYVPVSKKGVPCWNFISQVNAETVASNMYSEYKSVTSSLIDTYAWDTIMNWMENNNKGIETNSTNYGNYYNSNWSLSNVLYAAHTSSSQASTYSLGDIQSPNGTGTNRIELATGVLEQSKVLNIYDMAGNIYEWTSEYGYHNKGETATKRGVLRGGSFGLEGSVYPISAHDGSFSSNDSGRAIGFRVVLYLNYELTGAENEYETNGLIAHYDAINNTGSGHDSTATVWKDLSGNGNDLTLANFDGTDTSGWSENALNFDGTNDYAEVLNPLYNETAAPENMTIEIISAKKSSAIYGAVLSFDHIVNTRAYMNLWTAIEN